MLLAAVFLTLGLFAVPDDVPELLLLFVALFVSGALRTVALPRVRPYAGAVNRIPVIVRILVIAVVGYFIGQVVLTALSENAPFLGLSYLPMLVGLVLSILAASLLLPAPPAPREQARA